MKKIFIDGSAGTTGLRIRQRLSERTDLTLLTIDEGLRKDPAARKACLNEADIVFLCLPDDAAREAVTFIENDRTVVIDTSTAHRTDPLWAYGFPQLSKAYAEKLTASRRISVPGCHAGGFIALVKPLTDSGLLAKTTRLCCHSLTGYSGGGKKMIAEYEASDRSPLLDAPRAYGLSCRHKHLGEMQAVTGLTVAPHFCPIVADFYSGMLVTVPLFSGDLLQGATAADIRALYAEKYTGGTVCCHEQGDEDGFLSAVALAGSDRMEVAVFGNEERILLVARYDNLGKGASGAAIECMNIKLGVDPMTGLCLR